MLKFPQAKGIAATTGLAHDISRFAVHANHYLQVNIHLFHNSGGGGLTNNPKGKPTLPIIAGNNRYSGATTPFPPFAFEARNRGW